MTEYEKLLADLRETRLHYIDGNARFVAADFIEALMAKLTRFVAVGDRLREDFGESLDTYQGDALELYDAERAKLGPIL